MLPDITRRLILTTLEGNPVVIAGLLIGLTTNDARWDERPDEDRFTLREVTAHLADMEAVWHERIRRMSTEDNPFLPNADESQIARDNHYETSNPTESLARFQNERTATLSTLHSLSEAQWKRTGLVRGYHTKQIAERLFS
jgi:hypothetical protein